MSALRHTALAAFLAGILGCAPVPTPNSTTGVPDTAAVGHFDSTTPARPDPRLTPGDVFSGATAADVCTQGWAKAHRHVTASMRDRVYREYGRTRRPGCCEVDHLVPLELGGSNDIKNLWPQPDDPRPGDHEKDQLENELHRLVCTGKMKLADAQKCIAADWVRCWATHVENRQGLARLK